MRKAPASLLSLAALGLSLAGCASTGPAEPSLSAIPGKGKTYQAFQRDDAFCQDAAQRAIGGQAPGEAANQAAVGSAAVGTAVGALAGAAIGAASGNAGAGAAIGAGAGLLTGAAAGSANAQAAGGSVQARLDTVYAQCMIARGNQVTAPPPGPPPYGYPYYGYGGPGPFFVYARPYYWGPGYYHRYWW